MFYIGSFSKMGKTTVKTLHYSDRIGLLRPEEVNRATRYREAPRRCVGFLPLGFSIRCLI